MAAIFLYYFIYGSLKAQKNEGMIHNPRATLQVCNHDLFHLTYKEYDVL